jgi:hypothetical protein
MTAILSAIKPTRRPGELGVHSVDRFHLAVPDLAVARLSDRSGDGIAFLHGIHGSHHHMIAFVKSSAPG